MVGRLIQQQECRRGKERPRERDTHAPATRHVLGHGCHALLAKPEPPQQLRRPRFELRRIELVELLVDERKPVVVGPVLLHDIFRLLLQSRHLLHDVVNHGLKRGAVGRLRLLVQVVDIHVIRNRNLRDPASKRRKRGRSGRGNVPRDWRWPAGSCFCRNRSDQ